MKILHLTPHLGLGMGTILLNYMLRADNSSERLISLDHINNKAKKEILDYDLNVREQVLVEDTLAEMAEADIVVVNYWPNPYLENLLSRTLPPCRIVAYHHQLYDIPQKKRDFFDRWIETSPLLGREYIWSTGDIKPFLNITPVSHKFFNIGYVGTVSYKKLHAGFIETCKEIKKQIPAARFIVVGENNTNQKTDDTFWFTGKVSDVRPFLGVMDVFGYMLRPDHYGTCEQVLGEAMAAGLPCVVLNNPTERLIVRDNKDGLVAKNEYQYIHYIKTMYNNKDLYNEVSKNVRERAKELYDTHKMISEWHRVFKEMMQTEKRTR